VSVLHQCLTLSRIGHRTRVQCEVSVLHRLQRNSLQPMYHRHFTLKACLVRILQYIIDKRGPHLPSDFTNCENTLLIETPLEADKEPFTSWLKWLTCCETFTDHTCDAFFRITSNNSFLKLKSIL